METNRTSASPSGGQMFRSCTSLLRRFIGNWFLLLAVSLAFLFLALSKSTVFYDIVAFQRSGYEALSNCIADSDPAFSVYKNFEEVVASCKRKLKFNVTVGHAVSFNMGRYGERKYFLPFAQHRNGPPFECYWLTIGVGAAIRAETEFHAMYPNCKIVGVDPGGPSQYVGFEAFGQAVHAGLGPEDGNISLSVRQANNTSVEQVVKVIAVHKLLDDVMKSRLVHFCTLDIEGFEYHILQEMMNGGIVDSKNVVFCQMDVELHSESMQKTHMGKGFNVDKFLRTFLRNSVYTPIFGSSFLHHKKVTLINRANAQCERVFKFSSYWTT